MHVFSPILFFFSAYAWYVFVYACFLSYSLFFLLMLGMYLFVSKGKIMVNIETGGMFELNVRVHLNGDANYLHSC
jgi:hypothetical protein